LNITRTGDLQHARRLIEARRLNPILLAGVVLAVRCQLQPIQVALDDPRQVHPGMVMILAGDRLEVGTRNTVEKNNVALDTAGTGAGQLRAPCEALENLALGRVDAIKPPAAKADCPREWPAAKALSSDCHSLSACLVSRAPLHARRAAPRG